jgi:hypothetical protein
VAEPPRITIRHIITVPFWRFGGFRLAFARAESQIAQLILVVTCPLHLGHGS